MSGTLLFLLLWGGGGDITTSWIQKKIFGSSGMFLWLEQRMKHGVVVVTEEEEGETGIRGLGLEWLVCKQGVGEGKDEGKVGFL